MEFKNLFLALSFLNSVLYCSNQYNHELYLLCSQKSSAISEDVKNLTRKANQELGLAKFFDTQKIVDSCWVANEFKKDKTHSEHTVLTDDGVKIRYSFFDRKSDKLLIIGPGFTNAKEKMAPFVHMFTDYDIVIINFRGHGICAAWNFNPAYHLLGIDTGVQFGAKEELDIFAVVNDIRSMKNYSECIGLGVCFGAFAIAKAQAEASNKAIILFDKIILDGMWISLEKFASKIYENPALILNPQNGDAPVYVRWIFGKIKNQVQWCLETLTGIKFAHINIKEILQHIQVPTLIFYGKDDLTITRQEFEEMFTSIGSNQKAAIITNNPHVRNHLKSKEFYKFACEAFIDTDFDKFINIILNVNDSRRFIANKLDYKLNHGQFLDTTPNKLEQKKSNKVWYIGAVTAIAAAGYWLYRKFRN